MVTSTMIGGEFHEKRIYLRGGGGERGKVRTPRQPRGPSNTAAHLDLRTAIE